MTAKILFVLLVIVVAAAVVHLTAQNLTAQLAGPSLLAASSGR